MNKNFEQPESYKVAIERLQEIVNSLEAGDQDIETVSDLYQEGKFLADWCKQQLKSIEEQIKIVDPSSENITDFELGI